MKQWFMKNKYNLTKEGNIFIANENQSTFFEKLIKYYETKNWLYETSIDGIDL